MGSGRVTSVVGVRPDHIDVSPDVGEWKGRLRYVEHLGSDTVTDVNGEGTGPLTVRLPGEVAIDAG